MVNKTGETIASAVTNLDLHDLARVACTYGVRSFQVVTPLDDQQTLIKRIVGHWTRGPGGAYNPDRKQALGLIRLSSSLAEAMDQIQAQEGARPRTVATCAQPRRRTVSCRDLRKAMRAGDPWLIAFGTAWGLAPALIEAMDHALEPIGDPGGYNHLSVRCAAAVILDRLLASNS